MTASATSPDELREQLAMFESAMVDHFNAEHADAVALLARANAGHDIADLDHFEAVVNAISPEAVTIGCAEGSAAFDVVVPFPRPLADLGDVRLLAIEMIIEARTRLGITEPTSAEQVMDQIQAIPTRVSSVLRVEHVSPHFVQITFAGGDLDDYVTAGLDSFIYVLLPPPGRTELTIDSSFQWTDYENMPEEDRPLGAYYTARRWRPPTDGAPGELDMLFLLHEVGHATTWAAQAKAGDPVALWGPRTAWEPPTDTTNYVLVGDETGLPAIAVILEDLVANPERELTTADVFIEVGDVADRLPLPASDRIRVTWIERTDAASSSRDALVDAVRALAPSPDGSYAWGGSESRQVTAVRKYLRTEQGYTRDQVSMTGYWRHTSTTDADLAGEDD